MSDVEYAFGEAVKYVVMATIRGKKLTTYQKRKIPRMVRLRLYKKIMGPAWHEYHKTMYKEYVQRFGKPKTGR